MALISVIVPVYNVEKYLDLCIRSILNQSFKDFRLILVNDGSRDRSGEICDFYKDQDPRITVIHQENQGLSEARNQGLRKSREPYITFVDSDDWIHQDMVQVLYDNLISYGGDISMCHYQAVYEEDKVRDTQVAGKVEKLSSIEATRKIVDQSQTQMIIATGKLYKKSLFQGISYPRGKYHEDEFVTYKLFYRAKLVILSKASLYYYRQRKDSITGKAYSLKRLEKLEGLEEAIDFFDHHQETQLRIGATIRYLVNIQIAYYRVKDELTDQEALLKSLKVTYDGRYKQLMGEKRPICIFKKINLAMFYLAPNLYCKLVWLYLTLTRRAQG